MPYREPVHIKFTCEDCGKEFDACMSGYEDLSKCGRCWDLINMGKL